MIKLIEKYPIKTLIVFGVIMLLPNLEAFVLTIMEARNYITAREMLLNGNWLKTTMNGIARYEKPPLPTWLSAISGYFFGINNLFALRLPAALMIIFSAVFTYKISLKLTLTKERSLINGLILMTSFYVIAIIIEAPWDIYSHGFALASAYYFIDIIRNDNVSWKTVFLAGSFMGFSFLSKGPIGFYALFLPFIISYIYFYKFNNFKSKIIYLLVFTVIFLGIGFSWHIYIELVDPLSLNKITEHETENWSSYNVRPFYYYWNFFIQSGIWAILALISLLYPYLSKKINQLKEYRFIIIWIVVCLVLLSVIPEKKSRYLVPILFPLAINTGFFIEYLFASFNNLKNTFEKAIVNFNFYFFGCIGIVIPIAVLIYFNHHTDFNFLLFLPFFVVLIIIGFYILKSIYKKRIKNAFYLKVALMGVIVSLGPSLIKLLNTNKAYHEIVHLHEIENKFHIKSYYYKEIAPEIIWHYEGKIAELKSLKSIKKDTIGFLINVDDLKNLNEIPPNYNVKKIKEFNANYFKKERNRLIFDYYLVTKKN